MARELNHTEKAQLAAMTARTSMVAVVDELTEYADTIANEADPSPFKRSWERSGSTLKACSLKLFNDANTKDKR